MSWALLLSREQLFLLSASPSVHVNRSLYYASQLTHVPKPAICVSELGVREQVSVSFDWCLSGTGEEPDSKQRRLNLIKAVEGDDWSAVIDGQTQQTIEGMGYCEPYMHHFACFLLVYKPCFRFPCSYRTNDPISCGFHKARLMASPECLAPPRVC